MTDAHAEETIDRVLDEALQRTRRNETVNVEEYCRKYPDAAEELRCLLPALMLLERPLRQNDVQNSINTARSVIPDFQIIREVGRGAMGVVYEAVQTSLARPVALKVLNKATCAGSSFSKRFQREGEAAAQLHHTNIVPVFEAGTAGDYAYYAMQLIDGINLQQLQAGMSLGTQSVNPESHIKAPAGVRDTATPDGSTRQPWQRTTSDELTARKSEDPLSPTTCAAIAIQIAEGLAFAHEHGILHRDIKPSNILVDRLGRAWIADFGLARPDASENLTASGELVGTLRYMAPERFSGQCDPRCDIYGLGATLFELLEGTPAFRSDNQAQLIDLILNGPVPRLHRSRQRVGRDLERIVSKAISRAPADRYQSAAELATDLRLFLEGKPILARKPALHEVFLRWVRRKPLVAGLIAAILVLLSGGLTSVSILLVREREQSRIADENFHTALETVRTYLTAVSESPELETSGTQNLRRELLTAAQGYYQDFVKRHENRPELLHELADAHFQLGQIHLETGRLQEAEASFELARTAIAESVSHRVPRVENDDAEFQIRLSASLAEVSRQLGLAEAAEKHLIEALRIARELVDRQPGRSGPVVELAKLESQLGLILSSMDRSDDERQCYDRASALLKSAATADSQYFPQVISIHMQLGMARRQQGSLTEARSHFEQTVTLSRTLVDSSQTDPQCQSQLAKAYSRLGELELFEGKLADARSALRNATSILQELRERHPLVLSYREGQAACRINLGKVELTDGRFEEAATEWRLALQDYQRLVSDSPQVVEYQFCVGEIFSNLGHAAFRLGLKEEAIDHTRQALHCLQLLVEKYPDHPEYADVHAGVAGNLAAILNSAGQPAEALDRLRESISVQEKLSDQRGHPPSIRRALSFAHINAAGACRSLRRSAEALVHLGHARKILDTLLHEHPTAPEFLEGMAAAWTSEGRLHYDAGRPEDALTAFQQALSLNRTLVDAQPKNAAVLEELAVTHDRVAMSFRESCRFSESLTHSDETIRLLIAAGQLKSPPVEAAVGNYQLERAKILCRMGMFNEAISACRSASDVGGSLDRGCATVVIAHAQAASGAAAEAYASVAEFDPSRLADPRDVVELAAVWTLLGRASAHEQLTSATGGQPTPVTQEDCYTRAIALIESAVSRGFRNVAVLHSNPSLDSVRTRSDYVALLTQCASDPD